MKLSFVAERGSIAAGIIEALLLFVTDVVLLRFAYSLINNRLLVLFRTNIDQETLPFPSVLSYFKSRLSLFKELTNNFKSDSLISGKMKDGKDDWADPIGYEEGGD